MCLRDDVIEVKKKKATGLDVNDDLCKIFFENKELVFYIAKRYLNNSHAPELDDMTQEAFIALVEAIDTYNENIGEFSNWWIDYMRSHFRRMRQSEHIPEYLKKHIQRYTELKADYQQQHGTPPPHSYMQAHFAPSWILKAVELALMISNVTSLDKPLSDEDNRHSIADIIADESQNVEDIAIDKVAKEELKAIWETLEQIITEPQINALKAIYIDGEKIYKDPEKVKHYKKGLATLQRKRYMLKRFKEMYTDSLAYSEGLKCTGVGVYSTTGTSSTERAAFKLCEMKQNDFLENSTH